MQELPFLATMASPEAVTASFLNGSPRRHHFLVSCLPENACRH